MFMTRRDRLQFVGLGAVFLGLAVAGFGESANSPTRPNVIVFLADDLGYGDLGCYGNPIVQTPNIDKLAQEGLRLTDCHSAGTVCSPSRAALLTGRTPYRTGFYTIAGGDGIHLRREEITLATLLKKQGYDTCFVGKWHLGNLNNPASGQPGPGEHGFDHWFATQANAFDGPEHPGGFVRNGKKVGPIGQWYCDAIVSEAIAWLEHRPNPQNPFFLLVCSHEPHTPLHPPETYAQRYDNPTVDVLEKTIPYGQVPRPLTRNLSANKKYYYGTVTQLDDAFGTLMRGVDRLGFRENSLVVFTSDNGPETPVTLEESGGKWEDPIRDRCFGTPGPFRGMKRFVYEGGHRVPGLVRWPGQIKPGTLSAELVNGTDWLPTICAMAGAPLPSDRVIDGTSLLPIFNGQTIKREIPVCWMFPVSDDYYYLPSMAMRQGSWTLVGWFDPIAPGQNRSAWVKTTGLSRFELFDLSIDLSQRYDLSQLSGAELGPMKETMIRLWQSIQSEAPLWKTRPRAKNPAEARPAVSK